VCTGPASRAEEEVRSRKVTGIDGSVGGVSERGATLELELALEGAGAAGPEDRDGNL